MFANRDPSFRKQNGAEVVKPVAVNGLGKVGDGAAAGGGSRRALGDITNARGANQAAAMGKVIKTRSATAAAAAAAAAGAATTTTSSFGLASAAPPPSVLYQQPSSQIHMDAGTAAAVADTCVDEVESMELIDEVDEIDMNVEDTQELGTITKDLQDMAIKRPIRPVLAPDVDDIDQVDVSNPMACVEYVDDQYSHYREKECRPGYDPSYMAKQPYINVRMRAILVDWLVEVHYKFKCCPETLYLTVNIMDRFLDRKQVPRPKLQLVGVTAFLIACKYEEIYPPEVKELVYMTDGAYTRKQIIEMESFMLATLKFQVTVCTTHCFLVRFLKAGHADNKIYFLASYIAERTLQEVDILCFLPSMVAAAAVYLARKNCGLRPWSPTLVHYTKYTEETLLPCLRVVTPWLNSRSQTLQGIRKKYGSTKFMMVSNLELEGV